MEYKRHEFPEGRVIVERACYEFDIRICPYEKDLLLCMEPAAPYDKLTPLKNTHLKFRLQGAIDDQEALRVLKWLRKHAMLVEA